MKGTQHRNRYAPVVKLLMTSAIVLLLIAATGKISSKILKREESSRSLSIKSGMTTFNDVYFNPESRRMKNKKVLFGVFTMDRDKEKDRRQLIRDTYLRIGHPDQDERVCSFHVYKQMIDEGSFEQADKCTVLYTFISGISKQKAEADLPEDHFRSSRPLLKSVKGDMTVLNVKENLVNGKTSAYFKWAASISTQYNIDYIVKTDDDTLIFMPYLFDKIIGLVKPYPYNSLYYGGHTTDAHQCNVSVWDHCKLISPNGYMAGQFYFLSPDLADAVTNDEQERVSNTGVEDLDMGRSVFRWSRANKEMIKSFTHGGKFPLWQHPIKETDKWLFYWDRYYNNGKFDGPIYV